MKPAVLLASVSLMLAACDPDRMSSNFPVWSLHRTDTAPSALTWLASFDLEEQDNEQACRALLAVVQRAEPGRTFQCRPGRQHAHRGQDPS